MKHYEDAHRRPLSFQEGDLVFLRIPKSRYSSLKGNTCTKFAHRYYGPFKVLRKVGEVAYQLLLPNTTRIHDVFHVSQLKGYLGPDVRVVDELPPMNEEGMVEYVPESIIGKRERVLRTRSLVEFLIKWKDLPLEEASWQPASMLEGFGGLVDAFGEGN